MNTLLEDIGNAVRHYRHQVGWTQKQLAEKMGTSQATINRVEHGRHNPTVAWLCRCFTALGVEFHLTLDDKEGDNNDHQGN